MKVSPEGSPRLRRGRGDPRAGPLRLAPLVTFVVATGSFTLAGVGSAVWAMVAGLLAATVVELPELLACWREAGAER